MNIIIKNVKAYNMCAYVNEIFKYTLIHDKKFCVYSVFKL